MHASAGVDCAAVTKAQKVVKPMKPLKVVMRRDTEVESKDLGKLQREDPTLTRIRTWISEGKGHRPREKWQETV